MGGGEIITWNLTLSPGHPEGGRSGPPPRPAGPGTFSSARPRKSQAFPGPWGRFRPPGPDLGGFRAPAQGGQNPFVLFFCCLFLVRGSLWIDGPGAFVAATSFARGLDIDPPGAGVRASMAHLSVLGGNETSGENDRFSVSVLLIWAKFWPK